MDQTFGPDFGEQLLKAPVGGWFGPVESAYGLHLVRVLGRTEPRLAELRERLSAHYSFETKFRRSQESVDFSRDRLRIYPSLFREPHLPHWAHVDLALTGDSLVRRRISRK